MSNLTKEAIADTLYDLSTDQIRSLENCITSLTSIKDSKKITESNLKNLINVWRELDAIRELYFLRLLNSLKRGDMIKD